MKNLSEEEQMKLEKTFRLSHPLTAAAHSLSIPEKRLIYAALSHLHKDNAPSEGRGFATTITAPELADRCGISRSLACNEIKKLCAVPDSEIDNPKAAPAIQKRFIKFYRDGRNTLVSFPWVVYAEYTTNPVSVHVEFHEKLTVHIHSLGKLFTEFFLSDVFRLTDSIYSMRMWELLMRWKMTGVFRTTIDELRHALNIPEDKYTRLPDLTKRVINPALKEISEKNFVDVEYTKVKEPGVRKINKLVFTFPKFQLITLARQQQQQRMTNNERKHKEGEPKKAKFDGQTVNTLGAEIVELITQVTSAPHPEMRDLLTTQLNKKVDLYQSMTGGKVDINELKEMANAQPKRIEWATPI